MTTTDLVVCTRNRTETVLRQVAQIGTLDKASEVRLVIVDNSDFSTTKYAEFANNLKAFSKNFLELKLMTTNPGLVNARNLAMDNLMGEIVVFIDDDVRLPENFFPMVREIFLENTEVIGFAPLIDGLYSQLPPLHRNFLRIFNRLQGKLIPTTHSFWVDEDTSKQHNVNWLPGCCMIFKTSEVKEFRFSQELQMGAAGGYSLGEDVDFSSRVSRRGKLICTPKIKIFHDLSPINRTENLVLQKAIGEWRGYASSSLPHCSYPATFVFEFMYLVLSFFKGGHKFNLTKNRWNGFLSNTLTKVKHYEDGK